MTNPARTLDALLTALNAHDLDAIAATQIGATLTPPPA